MEEVRDRTLAIENADPKTYVEALLLARELAALLLGMNEIMARAAGERRVRGDLN